MVLRGSAGPEPEGAVGVAVSGALYLGVDVVFVVGAAPVSGVAEPGVVFVAVGVV